MTDFHRSVFVQKHHCHGFTNNIASSDNNAFFARRRNSVAVQKFHNARRGTGQKAVISAHNMSHVFRMECVHVFFRRNTRQCFFTVKALWQRHLHKNTVYIHPCRIGFYDKFQHLLSNICRKGNHFACYAYFFTGFCLVANVNLRSRVFSHKNNCKSRSSFGFCHHFFCFFFKLRPNFRRNFFTVNYRCHIKIFFLLSKDIVLFSAGASPRPTVFYCSDSVFAPEVFSQLFL